MQNSREQDQKILVANHPLVGFQGTNESRSHPLPAKTLLCIYFPGFLLKDLPQ